MMLHAIREKAKGWFAWVIVILISVPFALWGIGSYITPDANPPVAIVDDLAIGSYEFQNALQGELQQVGNPDATEPLKLAVLDRLINSKALLNHLQNLGYRGSRSAMVNQLLNDPAFKDPQSGQFSQALFKQVLNRMGLSMAAFEERMQQDLMTTQYLQALQHSVMVGKQEVEHIIALLRQKRDATFIEIDIKPFMQQIQLDEAEIEKYYQENKFKYEVPEKVKFAYIELSRKKLAGEIPITDEEVAQYYAENKARFTHPESRKASHILLTYDKESPEETESAQKLAAKIRSKLDAGEDFAALAKKYSQDPGSAALGGDLGFFKKGEMVPEFEEKVFAMALNQISEPVVSEFGLHIIKLTGIEEEQVKPLEAVRTQIIAELQFERAEKIYVEQSEAMQSIAYEQPDSLEPVAREIGATIQFSDFIPRTGGKGIFASQKFLAAIFDPSVIEEGNNSDAIEIGSDHLLVARVDNKQPAAIKPLEQVKAEIEAHLKRQKAREQALALAEEIAGIDADQKQPLLDEHQLEEKTISGLQRNGTDYPRELVNRIFSMPRPRAVQESVITYISSDDKAMVVRLLKVENAKVDEDENFAKLVSTQLKQARAGLMSNLAILDIRKQSEVEIFKSRLQQQE